MTDPSLDLHGLRTDFTRFMMRYKFGMDEVMTKVSILREELETLHEHNPIEHINARLKTPESIVSKAQRKGCAMTFDAIREELSDIAGVRITCSFESDVYVVFGMLERQHDLEIIEVKDYIAQPKPNGYRSLHAVVELPVFLSDGPDPVRVELQLRTIAMDFWASLEHKIHYKFGSSVPAHITESLLSAATAAADLDTTMERLHAEVQETRLTSDHALDPDSDLVPSDHVLRRLHAIRDTDD